MTREELKEFLDEKVAYYNHPRFVESDPIQIPHRFQLKEDIEISGFLTASIAWGNRKSIIKNATKMTDLMGESPYDFVLNHKEEQLEKLLPFVHRTFNGYDFIQFIKSLKHIYVNHKGLEYFFSKHITQESTQPAIARFKEAFFENQHLPRTQKHISNPEKGSAAKRINMYLRWVVRNDGSGVDFGIWDTISPSILSCPLDVHSGRVARKLGLLKRKQNDAKALLELDQALRKLDPKDPVKYDFALFGLGVFEGF